MSCKRKIKKNNTSSHTLREVRYPNGQLKERSHYNNGKEEGLSEVWDKDGNLIKSINYKDGIEID